MMLTRVFLTLLCLSNLFLSISGSTLDTAAEEKLRVQINATGDTIVLRFIRPQEAVKLEGYVLGYGGKMFSKQYIQLPKDGQPYYGEMDAEPKYLISVQPIKPNEVKKQCPGKLDLQKPLHLVIGSITPSKVMLTWGTLLKTPYSHDPDDCPQDGQYTIRYREQDTTVEPTPEPTPEPTQAPTSGPEPDRQWKYQTCPSSSTVIENLKPNTPYEFEVRANTDEGVGDWTPPIVHNTNASVTGKLVSLIENSNKEIEKPFKPPVMPKEPFLSRPILLNRTLGVMPLPRNTSLPGNRRILDATPTWALPTAFTPVTIPPPQSHTHRNITPPTKTTTTNQHGQTKQVVKTSVHKKDIKLHHQKTTASGQHMSTPPKALPPRPDTQHLRTPNTPVKNKHLRHRNRQPHLDAKYQPKTSTPKLHGHQSPITTPNARPLPKITGPGYVHETSTTTGQKQPSQDHLKGDIFDKSTEQQPRVPNQREEFPMVFSPVDALAPTAEASLPDMSKNTPITQRGFQTPVAESCAQPHTLAPGAERQSSQSNSEGTPHTRTQIHTTFSEGAPDTHTQVHTTLKHQPTGTQSTHNTDQTLLVGMATIVDGSLDSQSPFSKDQDSQSSISKTQDSQLPVSKAQDSQSPMSEDLHGLSFHPAHQTTERPAIFPSTDLSALENKTLISAPDEPITARQGLFPGTHSRPHPAAERLPTADKRPIKITQRPSKKQPTKTTNPSTNGNQPGGNPNKKPRQHAVKVKQPSKPRQAPDEHGQEPIKHSQQTSQGGKQPIKTGHKLLYQKQKQETTKEPIKTDQSVASTTDWLSTTGRPQDGHTQKNPSSPFSVTQYSLPSARLSLATTQPQQHTDRTRQETQSHTDTQHTQSHTQSPTHSHTHTTMTTQSPSQGSAKPAYPQPTQSVSQVTPSSFRVFALQPTTTKQQLRLLGRGRPRMRLPGPRPSVTTLLRTRRPFPAPPRPQQTTPNPQKLHPLSRKTDVAVEGMQGVTLTKPAPKARNGSSVSKRPSRLLKNGLNQVVKPDKGPKQEEKGSGFDSGENVSIFSPKPTSEVDAMGKKRFTAPHVIYQTDKAPEEPCSITQTLSHFPEEEPSEVNVTAPHASPSNVTVVAVEGCPSFVIIDWDKSDNETTEYEVTSSTNEGKEVSILVTNKTHTAVENLKPESRYEFTVTPKNELGVGPTSEPVTFSTESADPRVAEVTGKRAIWSTFPFQLDMGSECNGPQYIKRTWYRKFVGIQLCNSLRYKIYLSDSLRGPFYHIGDQSGNGEDHCQFVDSFLDGRTGSSIPLNDLPETQGFYRAMRQEPVEFGTIGGNSHINYVSWYECGVAIPGKW